MQEAQSRVEAYVNTSTNHAVPEAAYPPRVVVADDKFVQDSSPENDEIDLAAILATLWRGKWIIAICCVVALFVGGFYAYSVAVPLYTAKTTVIFEEDERSVSGLDSVVGGGQSKASSITTEMEVLRARGLIGKVVDRLDLTSDPEFNPRLREPSLRHQLTSKVLGVFSASDPMSEEPDPVSEGPAPVTDDRVRDAAISILLSKMSVSSVRNSLVFDITITTQNREKSALISDTLAELYILNQIEVKFEKMEQATEWLSDRVIELQSDVEAAEEAVSRFNSQTDLVSIESLRALERQLKETRDRIGPLREATNVSRGKLAELEAAETRAEMAAAASDPELTRLLEQVQADAAGARAAFDRRFERVLARVRSDLQRNSQQLAAVEQAAVSLTQQIETQSQDLIQLQQLTREAEATRLLYEHFLTRLKETSAQQGIQQADSRILSNAVVPGGPSFPRKSLILLLSTVIGAMIGVALVLLRELRNNSFRTAEELERHTGLSVLGQIPVIPAAKRPEILAYMQDKPTSAAMEAVRNLRTSLLLSNVDNPPKVIISTSSLPGEGKTTNALALAYNFIGMGKKVLLVEGDIRRRTLNEYFKNVPKHGIVSMLAGERGFDEVVFRPAEFDADIVPGDKSRINAADFFSSDKFREFVAAMRERYDVVIIDTPPVLVVPDARIIAQSADALLFSVLWDSTSRAQVTESLRLLRASSIRPTGVILSQISPKGMKRYGYGGRYGAYGAYGSKYYAN